MFEEITNVSVLSDKKNCLWLIECNSMEKPLLLFLQKSGGDCPPLVPTALLSLREISHKNRRNTVLENLDHPQAEQQLRWVDRMMMAKNLSRMKTCKVDWNNRSAGKLQHLVTLANKRNIVLLYSQIILRSKVLRHHFCIHKVGLQNGNGVLNRLVLCLKYMEIACWVLQAIR